MRRAIPLIPYIAVALGMYCIHSAWAALGLYHTGMLAIIVTRKRLKPSKNGLRIRPLWIYAASCLFVLGGIATYCLWPFLGHSGSSVTARLANYGVNKNTWPCLAVYFCLVNSTVEEFFWRGCLGSDNVRPEANDMLFAGYHAFVFLAFANAAWSVPVFVACVFAGWLWRMLRSATGSLAVPIITHVIADVGIVVAVHLRAFC